MRCYMRPLSVYILTAFLISACVRPDYAESRPEWLLLSAGPQPGYAIKRVIDKDPPETLVGDDGSICRTSRERFARTRDNAWLACVWSLPAPDTTDLANR
jgi:hypothetical protein